MKREIIPPKKDIRTVYPFIDGIFILNLLSREDRFQHILSELKRFNLTDYAYIIRSEKDHEIFARGCYESHLFANRLSMVMSMNMTLVLEDDFILSDKFFEKLERYIRRLPVGWYRLMVGHIPVLPKYDFKHRMFYGKCLCSTGYLFSREFAEWMPDYDFIQKIEKREFHKDQFSFVYGTGHDHTLCYLIPRQTYQAIPPLVLVDEECGTQTDHPNGFWSGQFGSFLMTEKGQRLLTFFPLIMYVFLALRAVGLGKFIERRIFG